jgi:hypothetical protein
MWERATRPLALEEIIPRLPRPCLSVLWRDRPALSAVEGAAIPTWFFMMLSRLEFCGNPKAGILS